MFHVEHPQFSLFRARCSTWNIGNTCLRRSRVFHVEHPNIEETRGCRQCPTWRQPAEFSLLPGYSARFASKGEMFHVEHRAGAVLSQTGCSTWNIARICLREPGCSTWNIAPGCFVPDRMFHVEHRTDLSPQIRMFHVEHREKLSPANPDVPRGTSG